MDFQAEVLKHLTDIKSDVGSLRSTSISNSDDICGLAKRTAWLERFVYGAIAIGGMLALLFPHGAEALVKIMADKPPEKHGDQ